MIRANAVGRDGKQVLILGLTGENLDRLRAGQPVHVEAGSVHPDVQVGVILLAGETEHQMMNDMRALIGPQTRMRIDPRLGRPGP